MNTFKAFHRLQVFERNTATPGTALGWNVLLDYKTGNDDDLMSMVEEVRERYKGNANAKMEYTIENVDTKNRILVRTENF